MSDIVVTTVRLDDGRVVDVFPSGTVQVYTAELDHGVELQLPDPAATPTPVAVLALG